MRTGGFIEQPIAAATSYARAYIQTGVRLSCAATWAQYMPRAHASALTACTACYPCRFVNYCVSRVEVMKAAGVIPVIVFDGGRLPMKASEEESRARFVR